MSTNPSLPDHPAANQNLAWLDGLDPSLTESAFTQAEVNTKLERDEFAATKAKHGEKTALADFNRRVLRWAQEFTNPRLARVMYVLGKAMSGTTHSYPISINGHIGSQPGIAEGKLLDRYRKTYAKHTISYHQFLRYLKMAEQHGLITRKKQEGRQGESGWHPGAWLPTITEVHFWRVLKDGKVVPHDFSARFPSLPDDSPDQPESKSATRVDTRDATRGATQSTESYEDSCSSLEQVKPKKRDLLPEEKSRPAASREATESGSCLRCSKPAARSIPGNDGQPIFRCDSCISKLPAFAKNLYSRGQDAQVRQPEAPSEPEEPENSYWVDRATQGFCKQSDYSRQDKMKGERKLVRLSRDEAVYLWKTLRSLTDRRAYMMHQAFGLPLPPKMPRMKVSREAGRQATARAALDHGWEAE